MRPAGDGAPARGLEEVPSGLLSLGISGGRDLAQETTGMGSGKRFYLGPERKLKILAEECESWSTCLSDLGGLFVLSDRCTDPGL